MDPAGALTSCCANFLASGCSRWRARFPWFRCPVSSINNFRARISDLQQSSWNPTAPAAAASFQECQQADWKGLSSWTLRSSPMQTARKAGLGWLSQSNSACLFFCSRVKLQNRLSLGWEMKENLPGF